jgi:glycosyltransferase involved in cell wall biosynthesis
MACRQAEGKTGIAEASRLKKLLFLSYYFPPLGMGGTQRSAKFAKYLSQFGWEPTVVTVKPISYWAIDDSALDELKHIRIIRTESLDPQRVLTRLRGEQPAQQQSGSSGGLLQKINQNIFPFIFVPDTKILWKYHCLQAVDELLKTEKFDAVFTTSPPHSVHLIGQKISHKYNLPWIADFRDSWAGGVVVHEPTIIQRSQNKRRQNKVIRNANGLTVVTRGIADEFSKHVAGENKIHYIPNGFDRADFEELNKQQNDIFTFCHIGSITQFSHPKVLFRAIRLLLNNHPELAQKIKYRFVGQSVIPNFKEMVEQYNLNDVIEHTGYVAHAEALKYLKQADALFLIALGKKRANFIPGKTYEYLGAQKPILAITNVNDTNEILKPSKLAFVNGPTDISRIADSIEKIAQNSQSIDSAGIDYAKQFDRKKQTEQLADILNSITRK